MGDNVNQFRVEGSADIPCIIACRFSLQTTAGAIGTQFFQRHVIVITKGINNLGVIYIHCPLQAQLKRIPATLAFLV